MRTLLLAFLISTTLAAQVQIRPVTVPQAVKTSAPAAIDAGDYLYTSAQTARRPDGTLPTTFADQCRQSLNNLKQIVEAAGLKLDNVVYTQVYLEDIGKYSEMNKIFGEYFPKNPPARAVLGIAKLPDSPIQLNAVAVRDLTGRQAVNPSNYKSDNTASYGMLTHDRLFVSSMAGVDPATGKVPDDPAAQVDLALDGVQAVLKAAGLDMANMVFVNPYLTSAIPARIMNEHYAKRFEFGNTPGRATIQISSLPGGAHIEYTGVAVRDLKQRRAIRPKNMPPSPTASPCVFAGDTLYCSAKSGFIPGPHGGVYADSTRHQARQTMRNLLDNLEEAEMKYDQVVSTTVYLDNLQDTQEFDQVYTQYFGEVLPARTTLQQIPPTPDRKPDKEDHFPDLEQMSLIAVRSAK